MQTLLTLILLFTSNFQSSNYPNIDKPTAGIFLDDQITLEALDDTFEMEFSSNGLDLLKKFEGEVRCGSKKSNHCPYNDSANYCTIGHGHLIAKRDCKTIEGEFLKSKSIGGISYKQFKYGLNDKSATDILLQDVKSARSSLERHMSGVRIGKTRISQSQYEALTNFIFNIGGTNFARSTLLKEIKTRKSIAGNKSITDQFLRWVKAGGEFSKGLENRRKDEVRHFFNKMPTNFLAIQENSTLENFEGEQIDIQKGEQ